MKNWIVVIFVKIIIQWGRIFINLFLVINFIIFFLKKIAPIRQRCSSIQLVYFLMHGTIKHPLSLTDRYRIDNQLDKKNRPVNECEWLFSPKAANRHFFKTTPPVSIPSPSTFLSIRNKHILRSLCNHGCNITYTTTTRLSLTHTREKSDNWKFYEYRIFLILCLTWRILKVKPA